MRWTWSKDVEDEWKYLKKEMMAADVFFSYLRYVLRKKKKKKYEGIKPKTSLNIIYLISFFVFIDVGFFYYVLSLWIQSITNIYL